MNLNDILKTVFRMYIQFMILSFVARNITSYFSGGDNSEANDDSGKEADQQLQQKDANSNSEDDGGLLGKLSGFNTKMMADMRPSTQPLATLSPSWPLGTRAVMEVYVSDSETLPLELLKPLPGNAFGRVPEPLPRKLWRSVPKELRHQIVVDPKTPKTEGGSSTVGDEDGSDTNSGSSPPVHVPIFIQAAAWRLVYTDDAVFRNMNETLRVNMTSCLERNCTLYVHTVLSSERAIHPVMKMVRPIVVFFPNITKPKTVKLFGDDDAGGNAEKDGKKDQTDNEPQQKKKEEAGPLVVVDSSSEQEEDAEEVLPEEAPKPYIPHLQDKVVLSLIPVWQSVESNQFPQSITKHLSYVDTITKEEAITSGMSLNDWNAIQDAYHRPEKFSAATPTGKDGKKKKARRVRYYLPTVYWNKFWFLKSYHKTLLPMQTVESMREAAIQAREERLRNTSAVANNSTNATLFERVGNQIMENGAVVSLVNGVRYLFEDKNTSASDTDFDDSEDLSTKVFEPNTYNITFEADVLVAWKAMMLVQMDASFSMQEGMGVQSAAANDEIKRMFLETNPWLLAVTVTVSLLHTVFEYLAFSNDLSFWRNKKDFKGMSLRTVAVNCYFQLIIFLYLFDGEETSWMILLPSAIGVLIEFWKLKKTITISTVTSEELQLEAEKKIRNEKTRERNAKTRESNALRLKEELASGEKSKDEQEEEEPEEYLSEGIVLFRKVRIQFVASYQKDKTRSFDEQAMRYLMMLLIPMLILYSIYSAVYDEHKGWWSFLIRTQVRFIYVSGFVMMTPQIFINYKLKSVAHMPWRAFVYKALNTFVDDLFAFIIKMPMMHRLACFRDDLVFIILLYQRWIYPVDRERVNEFGQGGSGGSDQQTEEKTTDEEEEKRNEAPAPPVVAESKKKR